MLKIVATEFQTYKPKLEWISWNHILWSDCRWISKWQ